jgi:hypothetical protein
MLRYNNFDDENQRTSPDLDEKDFLPTRNTDPGNRETDESRTTKNGKAAKTKPRPDLGFLGIFQRRNTRLPSILEPKIAVISPVPQTRVDAFNMKLIRSVSIKPKGK